MSINILKTCSCRQPMDNSLEPKEPQRKARARNQQQSRGQKFTTLFKTCHVCQDKRSA